jgi:hypothetical protein
MEIGGSDMIFSTSLTNQESRQLIEKLVTEDWPDAVYESAEDKCPENCFIYENEAAKLAWDDENCRDHLPDANMLYVLFGHRQITVVHDHHQGCATERLAKKIALYFTKLDFLASAGCSAAWCNKCGIPLTDKETDGSDT